MRRFAEFDGAIKRRFKFRRLHVVRIAAKARVAPAEIDGVRTRVTQAAEIFHVDVPIACMREAMPRAHRY